GRGRGHRGRGARSPGLHPRRPRRRRGARRPVLLPGAPALRSGQAPGRRGRPRGGGRPGAHPAGRGGGHRRPRAGAGPGGPRGGTRSGRRVAPQPPAAFPAPAGGARAVTRTGATDGALADPAVVDSVHRQLVAALRQPGAEAADARRLASGILRRDEPLAGARAVAAVVERVLARMHGLGVLEPYLADPAVTEVMVNGPGPVWVERDGVLQRTPTV